MDATLKQCSRDILDFLTYITDLNANTVLQACDVMGASAREYCASKDGVNLVVLRQKQTPKFDAGKFVRLCDAADYYYAYLDEHHGTSFAKGSFEKLPYLDVPEDSLCLINRCLAMISGRTPEYFGIDLPSDLDFFDDYTHNFSLLMLREMQKLERPALTQSTYRNMAIATTYMKQLPHRGIFFPSYDQIPQSGRDNLIRITDEVIEKLQNNLFRHTAQKLGDSQVNEMYQYMRIWEDERGPPRKAELEDLLGLDDKKEDMLYKLMAKNGVFVVLRKVAAMPAVDFDNAKSKAAYEFFERFLSD